MQYHASPPDCRPLARPSWFPAGTPRPGAGDPPRRVSPRREVLEDHMPAIPSLSGLRGRAGRQPAAPARIAVPLSAYVVDCAVYVDGKRLPGRWTHQAAINEVRERCEGFVWIGLFEPDGEQIQGIA